MMVEAPATPAVSPSTCPSTGPGAIPGDNCSAPPTHRPLDRPHTTNDGQRPTTLFRQPPGARGDQAASSAWPTLVSTPAPWSHTCKGRQTAPIRGSRLTNVEW